MLFPNAASGILKINASLDTIDDATMKYTFLKSSVMLASVIFISSGRYHKHQNQYHHNPDKTLSTTNTTTAFTIPTTNNNFPQKIQDLLGLQHSGFL